MTTVFNVSNESQLDAAIASIDVSGSNSASNTAYTINITQSFQLSSDPLAFNLAGGDVVTINGGNNSIDGAGSHRGLFVYAGTVDINNLTIQNAHAAGGAGGIAAGGGAGLGGGLFIAAGAAAAISNVTFSNDAATGGAGGRVLSGGVLAVGGGGGMGGAGGNAGGGGGGGIGSGAIGGGGSAGAGIVIGAAGGGTAYGGGGTGSNGGGGAGGVYAGGGGGIGGGSGTATGSSHGTGGGAGGFGGGGGGWDEVGYGLAGPGGFGGGGGGSGFIGGHGGFGGGGGGGELGGAGGFGAGSGASVSYTDGGGGGLGAGGDIFVQQGGSLTVGGGSLGAGTVTGGSGAGTGGSGSGLGSGIFIQGNQSITLAPPSGTPLTISGVIADQQGNGGSGQLKIAGTGNVVLTANNTYAGGTTLSSGSLELANSHAAGGGEINFAGPSAELIVDSGDTPGNTLGSLQSGDTIDLKGIGIPTASTLYGDGSLTVDGSTSVTLKLDSSLGNCIFGAASDGSGGTLLTVKQVDVPTSFSVGSEAQWNAAVAAIDANGADVVPNTNYTINLTGGFSLSSDPDAVNLGSGDTLTINGNSETINGAGSYRGLFVYSGQVAVNDLTLSNTRAIGGAGGNAEYAGGGGAGLGGGLFVASGGNVTLSGVYFTGDSATGGAGGSKSGSGGGGGGGLGGAGGNGRFGGGGGVGQQATGNGSAGIVIGAASGGASTSGAGGINGGGGGAAAGGGGGGGVGGASEDGGFGANGGFGGGGAGGVHSGRSGGGNGGFGGGGGGYGNQEGAGGFGGGGGAYHVGGFGAGAGNGNASNGGGGGGGLGAGGDVFVQQGATLSIGDGSLGAGTVKGGAGGSGAAAGSAYASGMFIEGNEAVALSPAISTTLTIAGVIADQAGSGGSGAGSLNIAGAGTVDLVASNTYSGGTQLTSGELQLGNAHAAGSGSIAFAGNSAELSVGFGDAPGNTLAGLVAGDKIDLDGIGLAPVDPLTAEGTFNVTGTTSATLTLAASLGEVTFGVSADGAGGTLLTVESETACYRRGTRILTERGEVPIECLQINDMALTASGARRPIRWLGHRRIACGRHPDRAAVLPIRIQAGAIAEGLPVRDLWVSPGHSLLFDEVLIQAHRLVNDATIEQVPTASIEYWHVELDSHDLIVAEGVAAESYLDTGNRTAFYEGGEFLEANPDFKPKHWKETCAPMLMDGPVLQGVKLRLLERAGVLGHSLTADSDVHIVASGERIEPLFLGERRLAFIIPPGRTGIELRCRGFVPCHVNPHSSDPRRLGVCVGRLQLDGCDLPLDAVGAFEFGWHELEVYSPTHQQRWSTESAPLPDHTQLVVIDVAGRSYCWSHPGLSAVEPTLRAGMR